MDVDAELRTGTHARTQLIKKQGLDSSGQENNLGASDLDMCLFYLCRCASIAQD